MRSTYRMKGQSVKYVILIYSNPANWAHPMYLYANEPISDEEQTAMRRQGESLLQEIADSGELIDSGALANPLTTRTIRARDGAPAITDGPFAETKEQLAGFFVVECESL